MTNLEILRNLKTDEKKTMYVKSGLMNIDLRIIKKIKMLEWFYSNLFRDLIESEKLSIVVEVIDGYSISKYNWFYHYKGGKLMKSYLKKEDDCLHVRYYKYDDCGRLIEDKEEDYKYIYKYNEFGDKIESKKIWKSGEEETICSWTYEYYQNTNKKKVVKWGTRLGDFINEFDENENETLFKRTSTHIKDFFVNMKRYDDNNNILEEFVTDENLINNKVNITKYHYNHNGHIIQKICDLIGKDKHEISKVTYEYEYYTDGKTIKTKKETLDCGTYSIMDYDMNGNLIRKIMSNGRVLMYDIEMLGDVFYTVVPIDKNLMFFQIVE